MGVKPLVAPVTIALTVTTALIALFGYGANQDAQKTSRFKNEFRTIVDLPELKDEDIQIQFLSRRARTASRMTSFGQVRRLPFFPRGSGDGPRLLPSGFADASIELETIENRSTNGRRTFETLPMKVMSKGPGVERYLLEEAPISVEDLFDLYLGRREIARNDNMPNEAIYQLCVAQFWRMKGDFAEAKIAIGKADVDPAEPRLRIWREVHDREKWFIDHKVRAAQKEEGPPVPRGGPPMNSN